MRLKHLEIVGFKSFAQKTDIELTPGITAVVGPNGCGKSNIVDAMRWAMGEQSAKHLRGHLMEDVIFNGSDSLPATGMGEVSLIFDNEDGRGPVEYNNFSEIMVTRRLYRSGESEYAINKVPSRLKDVVELFLGTGVGSKAYSIVEQGRVDELVNAKPEDRRSLIEEASGTSKYKSRKLVAERKVERTQQNLLRVTDIVREIERQIRTMELQAKKAERYRALKSELKEKELACAVLQRQAMDRDLALGESQFRGAEDRLGSAVALVRSKEAESEAVRLSVMEFDREISAQQEKLYQHKVQVQTDEQKIDFLQRDLSQLNQTEAETHGALLLHEGKLKDLALEIEELNHAKDSFVQLSLFEESFLRDKETELEKLQREIRLLQEELDREKEALIDVANQIAHLNNHALLVEKRRSEIAADRTRSQEEHAAVARVLTSLEQKRGDAENSLASAAEQARQRALEAVELAALIRTLSDAKAKQDHRVESLKEQIQERRSRLVSLEDLQKNYEGYQEGVRAIMLKKQQEAVPNGIYGLVAEVMDAPEPYEKALTAVLGDRLQYVIVKGHEEGIEAIEYLKDKASGRGSFIPLHLSRRQHRPLPLHENEVVAPLLEMISVKDGYRDVAEYLLSDVVVVRNLKAGLALWNRNGFYSTLVTPDGEVIDPLGIVTGGSESALEGSFLTQRRRIKELRGSVSELEAQLQTEEGESKRLKEALEQAEVKKSLLAAEIHRLELDRVRFEHECHSANQDFQRLTDSAQALLAEQSDLDSSLQRCDTDIRECHQAATTQLREKNLRESHLEQKQSMFVELSGALEALQGAVTQSRIRNAALGEKKENAHITLENRLQLQQETAEQIISKKKQWEDILARRSEIEESLVQAEGAVVIGQNALREAEKRLHENRQKYKNISLHLAAIEETIKELRPLAERAQEEKNRLQLHLAEKKLHLQHLVDNISEKYSVELGTVLLETSLAHHSTEELLFEIDELRGRLERMGDVNLAAIGEYEDLTSRFQFMSRQKDDLEKSIADLQQTIVKLNRICRLRFKESFEEINEKFESIFPRLFRGGKAKLLLTDENDYLETGVDIVAQPPGKKLQSITLLSGGEKALTAVSLLFAIFLTKPSPFCFLDEVDAPLDDANIDRFIDLVKEMSQFSQFVLVTHNKKTMQAAEVLYGITMAEPGVSKVVSVKMS